MSRASLNDTNRCGASGFRATMLGAAAVFCSVLATVSSDRAMAADAIRKSGARNDMKLEVRTQKLELKRELRGSKFLLLSSQFIVLASVFLARTDN